MRISLLLLTILLMPLTSVALDFQHRDTVLLTDIDGERFGAVFLYEDRGTVLCGELNAIFCDGFEDKNPGGL